ncbi:MAG: hypothetical protein ACREMW_12890 [Gemmatimonadales bacterium]
MKKNGELRVRMGTASGVILFHPAVHSGFRLKGSIGISAFENTGVVEGDILIDDRQFGGTAALGVAYDVRLSPNMSVSPGFSLGSTMFFGDYFGEFRSMWQLGVGLTWH